MGADMTVSILWTEKGKTYPQQAKQKMRELLSQETDTEIIQFLTEKFLEQDLSEELYIKILLVDEESKKTWVEKIARHYDKLIDSVENTLNTREVCTLHLTDDVWGYATGGMSWGDSPTEAMAQWDDIFYEYEHNWFGNPYAQETAAAYGLLATVEKPQPGQKKILISLEEN